MPKYLFATAAIAVFALLVGFSGSKAFAQVPGFEFTLESLPDDTPGMLRYKAALRLFAGVGAVRSFCTACNNENAWKHYERRNGNSINLVVRLFEAGGGLGDQQRNAVNQYAQKLAKNALSLQNCSSIMHQVDRQEWDIYKSARFKEDYAYIKQKKK
jgi:hypothetical protein